MINKCIKNITLFGFKIESNTFKEYSALKERVSNLEYKLILEEKKSFEYKKKYEEQYDRADKLFAENLEAWSAKFHAESDSKIQRMLRESLLTVSARVDTISPEKKENE